MNWIKIINSPFKLFKLKWYIGKTAIGVPYFFPRKWVKLNHEDRHRMATKDLERFNKHFEANPDSKLPKKDYIILYKSYENYTKPVPIRERHWQEHYNVLSKKGLNCKITTTLDKSGIIRCCKGKQKKCGNFIFKYKEYE